MHELGIFAIAFVIVLLTQVFGVQSQASQGNCPLIERIKCSDMTKSILVNAEQVDPDHADSEHPIYDPNDIDFLLKITCWCAKKAEDKNYRFMEIGNTDECFIANEENIQKDSTTLAECYEQGNQPCTADSPFCRGGTSTYMSYIIRPDSLDECSVTVKRVGCFKDKPRTNEPRLLPNYILTGRGKKSGSPAIQGPVVQWHSWDDYLPMFVCLCAEKAFSLGEEYIGIQFSAECWTGKVGGEYVYDQLGSTDKCVGYGYQKCQQNTNRCAGGQDTNFVYSISPLTPTTPDIPPATTSTPVVTTAAPTIEPSTTTSTQPPPTTPEAPPTMSTPPLPTTPEAPPITSTPTPPTTPEAPPTVPKPTSPTTTEHKPVPKCQYVVAKEYHVVVIIKSMYWQCALLNPMSREYRTAVIKSIRAVQQSYAYDWNFVDTAVLHFSPVPPMHVGEGERVAVHLLLKFREPGQNLERLVKSLGPDACISAKPYRPFRQCPHPCPSNCGPTNCDFQCCKVITHQPPFPFPQQCQHVPPPFPSRMPQTCPIACPVHCLPHCYDACCHPPNPLYRPQDKPMPLPLASIPHDVDIIKGCANPCPDMCYPDCTSECCLFKKARLSYLLNELSKKKKSVINQQGKLSGRSHLSRPNDDKQQRIFKDKVLHRRSKIHKQVRTHRKGHKTHKHKHR